MPDQVNERLTISSAVLNEIVNVITTMPWAQVNPLIEKIKADVRPIERPATDEANTGDKPHLEKIPEKENK